MIKKYLLGLILFPIAAISGSLNAWAQTVPDSPAVPESAVSSDTKEKAAVPKSDPAQQNQAAADSQAAADAKPAANPQPAAAAPAADAKPAANPQPAAAAPAADAKPAANPQPAAASAKPGSSQNNTKKAIVPPVAASASSAKQNSDFSTASALFLDRIIAASERPTCEETEKALAEIPESDFENASKEIISTNSQQILSKYQEKLSKLNSLLSRCPKVQDAFAKRLSQWNLKTRIEKKTNIADQTRNLEAIQTFVTNCEAALMSDSCETAVQKISAFPRSVCDNAIIGFQALDPNTLADSEYKDISDKLQMIMNKSASCPEFQRIYKTCLTPGAVTYRPSSELEPLFAWIQALQKAFETTPCNEISSIRLDSELEKSVQTAFSNVKPSEYSPEDLKKLQTAIQNARKAGKACPEANIFLQKRIDQLFL